METVLIFYNQNNNKNIYNLQANKELVLHNYSTYNPLYLISLTSKQKKWCSSPSIPQGRSNWGDKKGLQKIKRARERSFDSSKHREGIVDNSSRSVKNITAGRLAIDMPSSTEIVLPVMCECSLWIVLFSSLMQWIEEFRFATCC